MLAGLEKIDWHSLTHAYGPADDVPETLMALASGAIHPQEAMDELWGNIWHQGTVYQATAFAVPFLIEIVENKYIQDRETLLILLASIAQGDSYRNVHGNNLLSEDWEEFNTNKAEELSWAEAAHQSVSRGIPLFLNLLTDTEARVRAVAAYTLSSLPDTKAEILPTLRRIVQEETDTEAKASQIFALEALADNELYTETFFQTLLREDTEPLLRLVAALVLTRKHKEETPPHIIQILIANLIDPSLVPDSYAFTIWNIDGGNIEENICDAISLLRKQSALTILVEALETAKGQLTAYSIIDALLALTFESRLSNRKIQREELTADQRYVLTALVSNESIWHGNAVKTLEQHYSLPGKREPLQRFLDSENEEL